MASKTKLDPLREFLDAVVTRIENLEAHCGLASKTTAPTAPSTPGGGKRPSVKHIQGTDETPALKAYDKFLFNSVYPLGEACDDLNGLGEMGKLLLGVFEGVRYVIVLSSRAKAPDGDLATALTPHLQETTEALGVIRKMKLAPEWTNHYKACVEMLTCVSWLYCTAPKSLPVPFIKECMGSSDFWSNRIRKEFKGKSDDQIAFCDSLKDVMTSLASYVEEYHKTGLSFNPKGISIEEAAARLTDNPMADAAAHAVAKKGSAKRSSNIGNTVKGGNILGLMSELAGRKNEDGTSAATGLKKVTKEKQTWRKEYKKEGSTPTPKVVVAPPAAKKVEKKKKKGLPILEYQDRGSKWVIENQDETTAKNHSDSGILEVDITDPKQQVYIFNCDNVTVKLNGPKLKSIIIDTCTKINVVFDTIISGCELVNSKKIQVQVDGICPAFTIDKTIGVTVWLSEASLNVSSFVTSMSSEMNVSFPDGEDRKELPIPEQFHHKVVNGSVTSEVSDLYH